MRGQNVRLFFRVLALASVLDGPYCVIVRLIPSQIVSARFCVSARPHLTLLYYVKIDPLPTGNSQRAESPEAANVWVILIHCVLPERPECKHRHQFLSIGLLQVYAARSLASLAIEMPEKEKAQARFDGCACCNLRIACRQISTGNLQIDGRLAACIPRQSGLRSACVLVPSR
jgi:hypothetical protein